MRRPTLAGLIIDTDKDWQGYRITNLGEPIDPNDAARKIYVDVAATGLGINYFLLDEPDSEVMTYKAMSLDIPELSEAYVETSQNSAGEYEIASWIAPSDGIPLKLGVYELHCQAEVVSGNIDVRLFFRLYEMLEEGELEIPIAESMLSDKIDSRRDIIISLILANDYVMASGSRLVVKLFAKYESGGSSTTVRVYYQGDVRSRLACPIAKEILDTVYAARVHTHSPSDISPQGSGSGLDADTLDGLHASDILAQVGGKSLVAADETEVSTTSTSNTSMKQFNLVKLSSVGNDWRTMTVIAEGYNNTSGQTTYLDIYIGGTKYATITWTETSYTIKGTQIDISGLDDGKYLVDFQMRVTGGTGYLQLVEVWVE